MTTGVRESIDRLYGVLKRYKLRVPVEQCECGTCRHVDDAALMATGLRATPAALVDRLAFRAMSTWGGVEEFKHFLPRILECYALDYPSEHMAFDSSVLGGKLAYGEWLRWRAEEQQAVKDFVLAFWRERLIAGGDEDCYALEPLELPGRAGMEMGPFLREWEASLQQPLAKARLGSAREWLETKQSDEWAENWVGTSAAEVREWLIQQSV